MTGRPAVAVVWHDCALRTLQPIDMAHLDGYA
jgi:hypothetical protein